MDSIPKKTVRQFRLVDGHHFLVHRQDFQKLEKISFIIVAEIPFLTL